MLGLNSVILCLADNIVLKSLPVEKQFYAFNTATGDHFALNHTAFWVLNQLREVTSFSDLETDYLETFNLDKGIGSKHLKEVIKFSLTNELIKEVCK